FVIACTEDAQELETVNAGTRSGMPEPRATSLAMLGVLTDGITLPKTSAPTSAGSISVLLTSSVTAILPRSSGVRSLYMVPDLAKGVLRPDMIATRFRLSGWLKGGSAEIITIYFICDSRDKKANM